MPLVYQQNINATTKIAVWHITEPEDFFLAVVPVQREIKHWHKRLQHLAGRLLLKEMYPDFPVELIQIAGTKKLFLENVSFPPLNVSHYLAVLQTRPNCHFTALNQPPPQSCAGSFVQPRAFSLPYGFLNHVLGDSDGFIFYRHLSQKPHHRHPRCKRKRLPEIWEGVFV